MKKLLILLILFTSVFSYGQVKIPEKLPNTFVFDYTNTLSKESIDLLNKRIKIIKDSTKADIRVVLYDDFEKGTEADLTLTIFRTWGIGDVIRNDGVLYLISPKQRITRIEVGKGLEGNLPDITCKEIQAGVRNYYKNKDWYGGIDKVLDALYPKVVPEVAKVIPQETKQKTADHSIMLISIIGFVIIFSLLMFVITRPKKKKGDDHSKEVNNRTKLDYWNKCMSLITNFNNTKHEIEKRIKEAIASSELRLGYEYKHNTTYDKHVLDNKIKEIVELNENSVYNISLDKISSAYYNLITLIRSYTNLPRNIDIVVGNILKKRKQYDHFLDQLKTLHSDIKSKHDNKSIDLKSEKYKTLVAVHSRKEDHYDSLMSLVLYYQTLLSRHHSKTHLNKASSSALTSKKIYHEDPKPTKKSSSDNFSTGLIAGAVIGTELNNNDDIGWGRSDDTPSVDTSSNDSSSYDFGGGSTDGGGATDSF